MLRNFTMSRRIYTLVVMMMLSLIIMGLALNWGIHRITDISVADAQAIMVDNQKEKLHIAVHSMAEALGRIVRNETTPEGKKRLIREAIAPIRFEDDHSGYYFVYDFSGVNVAHPLKPQFQGTNRLDIRDPDGKAYIRELMNKANSGNFVEYTFEKPGRGNVKKLALSESIPGTDYWIATGFYMDNIATRKEAIRHKINTVSQSILIALTTLLLLLFVVILPLTQAIIRSMMRPLQQILQAVRSIGEGRLETAVNDAGRDELSELGRSFNEMTGKLRSAMNSLTTYQEHLEDLVKQRTEALSNSLEKLEVANSHVLESIQYARTIQQSMLPPEAVIAEFFRDYFVIWDPKDIIGGDFYWFTGDESGCLVGVVDCTGHGVPGAIMTMIAGTTLSRVVNEMGSADPARILGEVNRIVRQTLSQNMENTQSDDGLDMGLCLVKRDGTVVFAGAKISLFILMDGETREIRGDRFSIGYKSSRPDFVFTNHPIKVEPGMTFYMTTDGLKDQVGGDDKVPFGKSRLLNLLQSLRKLPLSGQKEEITRVFEAYASGETRRDDITLFGFRL